MTHTPAQIAEMRKKWDIPHNFYPVATAHGVIAWAKGGKS